MHKFTKLNLVLVYQFALIKSWVIFSCPKSVELIKATNVNELFLVYSD